MAYMQVKDLLSRARELREYVHDYAERQRKESGDDLLAGFFSLVSEHEEQLQQILAEHERDSAEEVMATWIQFPGDSALEEAMENLSKVNQQDDEVVMNHIIDAEESLAQVYDQAKRQLQSPRLQELFGELIQAQDHHLRNLANCVTEWQLMKKS